MIAILEDIVSQMNNDSQTFAFLHGEKDFQNLSSDEFTFPAVYVDRPLRFTPSINQSGFIGRKYKVNILFIYKSQLDWTPSEHDEYALDPARLTMDEFISRCTYENGIQLIEPNGDATEIINMFDVNVDAIAFPCLITPVINNSVCLT